MASRTITYGTFTGTRAGVTFTNGSATVDDTTAAGIKAIAFAKRHGLAVSGTGANSNVAEVLTVDQGKPVDEWTLAEHKAYLTAWKVEYPSTITLPDALKLTQNAFETKSQGGSGLPEGVAGHDSGTIPPVDAPPVSNPEKPDNADKTLDYRPPTTGSDTRVPASITTQPAATATVAANGKVNLSVAVAGDPEPTIQWQRQAKGTGAYAPIDGATSATYQTPALTVADNNQDRYRAIIENALEQVTSSSTQVTVTA